MIIGKLCDSNTIYLNSLELPFPNWLAVPSGAAALVSVSRFHMRLFRNRVSE